MVTKDSRASAIFFTPVSALNSEPKSLVFFSFRYRWSMRVLIFVLALLGGLAGVMGPLFQKLFVDHMMGTQSQYGGVVPLGVRALDELPPMVAIIGAFMCLLASQGLALFGNYLSVCEGTYLQREFGRRLYAKALSIRPDSLGSTTVGEVVSIFATDIVAGTALIDQVLPMAVVIVCNLVLGPLAVYWICGIPMWITFLALMLIVAVTVSLAFRQSKYFGAFKQLAADRAGLVNEWVQSIRMLRILGWTESFERKIFVKRMEETRNRKAMVTNGQFMNSFGSSINFAINLTGVASLIYLSGKSVSPGGLFAMLWIFGVFMARSFRQLPWFFTFIFDSTSSLRRLELFLSRVSDAGPVDLSERANLSCDGAPAITVRGLSLAIRGTKVLNDVDFDVKGGEFAAFVGEVGSGKSLLVLSLVGETGATFREFRIGGADALDLDVNERRRFFSFVPQEGFVMSATLRENIVFRYSAERAHDSDVMRALEAAQFKVGQEILGPGLDTEIGERGINLSGGQRQRVSLARSRYLDRPVVLLDDCLSAVDVDTEKRLVASLLDGDWKDRTRILVTHRLSVLELVDKIFILENGSIVETGTYRELIKKSRRMQDFVASVRRQAVENTNEPPSLVADFETMRGEPDVEPESIS